jgi:hypothetical protein
MRCRTTTSVGTFHLGYDPCTKKHLTHALSGIYKKHPRGEPTCHYTPVVGVDCECSPHLKEMWDGDDPLSQGETWGTPKLRLGPPATSAFPRWSLALPPEPVLQHKHSSLLLVSEPEFHAEWLRDGPCDATTTGSSNLRHRCQLSLTLSGGEHEIRGADCIASR